MMYYIRLFWKTLYISMILCIITTGGYLVYDQNFIIERYEASINIMVNEDVNSPYIDHNYGENYTGIITNQQFVEYLINDIKHYIISREYTDITTEELIEEVPGIENYDYKNEISTSYYSGTNIVTVTAAYKGNYEYPAMIVNTLAENFKEKSAKVLNTDYFILCSTAVPEPKPVGIGVVKGSLLIGFGTILCSFGIILVIDILARSEGKSLPWGLIEYVEARKNGKN